MRNQPVFDLSICQTQFNAFVSYVDLPALFNNLDKSNYIWGCLPKPTEKASNYLIFAQSLGVN